MEVSATESASDTDEAPVVGTLVDMSVCRVAVKLLVLCCITVVESTIFVSAVSIASVV